jgi:hypothetical protein
MTQPNGALGDRCLKLLLYREAVPAEGFNEMGS